jgi:hypothetical protein
MPKLAVGISQLGMGEMYRRFGCTRERGTMVTVFQTLDTYLDYAKRGISYAV